MLRRGLFSGAGGTIIKKREKEGRKRGKTVLTTMYM